jgi:hypothetical protein
VSRGLGIVQRRLIAALNESGRRFRVKELAETAFPGEPIERKHEVSVRRALRTWPALIFVSARQARVAPVVGVTSYGVRDKCCF